MLFLLSGILILVGCESWQGLHEVLTWGLLIIFFGFLLAAFFRVLNHAFCDGVRKMSSAPLSSYWKKSTKKVKGECMRCRWAALTLLQTGVYNRTQRYVLKPNVNKTEWPKKLKLLSAGRQLKEDAKGVQICPELNANEIQICFDKHHKVFVFSKKSPIKTHTILPNT